MNKVTLTILTIAILIACTRNYSEAGSVVNTVKFVDFLQDFRRTFTKNDKQGKEYVTYIATFGNAGNKMLNLEELIQKNTELRNQLLESNERLIAKLKNLK